MRVLLLDSDAARRDNLAELIRAALPNAPLSFDGMAQCDVFKAPPAAGCAAAFIWLGGMPDMEAARQLARAAPKLPLVLVSNSRDYGLESYKVQARYYLLHPIEGPALHEALSRCGLTQRPELPNCITVLSGEEREYELHDISQVPKAHRRNAAYTGDALYAYAHRNAARLCGGGELDGRAFA